ncbi:MAG: hypothetical protein WD512_06250 [Candidatus Paceibacterota bacterium]
MWFKKEIKEEEIVKVEYPRKQFIVINKLGYENRFWDIKIEHYLNDGYKIEKEEQNYLIMTYEGNTNNEEIIEEK